MVAHTSKEAYAKNASYRETQKDRVLNLLIDVYPTASTAEEISELTGIKLTTIYARLNDIKNGHTSRKSGITYFVYSDNTAPNKDGNTSKKWILSKKKRDSVPDLEEQKKQIESKILSLFAQRKRLKNAIFEQTNKSLF